MTKKTLKELKAENRKLKKEVKELKKENKELEGYCKDLYCPAGGNYDTRNTN